jgi:hypothetical protein
LREVIQIFVKSFDEPVCMENRGKWVDASMAERAAVSVLDLEKAGVSEVQVDAKMGESARDMSHEEGSRFSYPVLDPPYAVSRTAVDHADPAAFALAFAAAFIAAWSPCPESRGYSRNALSKIRNLWKTTGTEMSVYRSLQDGNLRNIKDYRVMWEVMLLKEYLSSGVKGEGKS